MLDHERTVYAWVLDYARKLAAGIPDDKMTAQPAPGMNPPAWVLGHLAIAADYAASLLGEPMTCPRAWHQMFGPGSDPAAVTAPPPKAELLAALEGLHERVSAAAARVTPERLKGPHGLEPLKKALPTAGDLLLHLMTTHPAMHLGQLSAWRRLNGLPAVLGF